MRRLKRDKKIRAAFLQAARRQRKRGRKLLALWANDAAQLRPVRIFDPDLARQFERYYPEIERCARFLEREDCARLLGQSAAGELAGRLEAMIVEVVAEQRRELEAASAYVAEVAAKLGERFVRPTQDRPAFNASVPVHGASAEGALAIFGFADLLLSELETLYWNGLRSISDRNELRLRAKRLVRRVSVFAEATNRNVLRLLKAQSAEGEARRPDPGGAPGEHTKARPRPS